MDFVTTPNTNGSINISGDFTLYFKARDVKVISRDYTNEFQFPGTGIDDEPNSLAGILLYNAFLALSDSNTGYRYSFTLWKTEVGSKIQYQVFLYCNATGNEFGVWSQSFDTIPDNNYMYLLVQRKNNTFTLKVLFKEA